MNITLQILTLPHVRQFVSTCGLKLCHVLVNNYAAVVYQSNGQFVVPRWQKCINDNPVLIDMAVKWASTT